MTNKKLRIAVLLSGAGSTMVNLQEHIASGTVNAKIVVAVSSKAKVLGIEKAKHYQIPTEVLSRRKFKSNGKFDAFAYSKAMSSLLDLYNPQLVVMAGFMTRLTAPLLDQYSILNVHPALLPMFGGEGFYGHHVHEAVLKAGVKISGATVHFANGQYDKGPIIMQEAVEVLENDTPCSLADRVQAAERRIYPKAVELYARGLVKIENNRTKILSKAENK